MTALKSLTFAALPKPGANPTLNRRTTTIARLEEQKLLLNDPSYIRVSQRWTKKDGERVAQLIETIDELHKRECGFRSLTEAIDTTTAGGRLIFHIFGALAEFERSIIRERTMAGLEAARARGRRGGRPRALGEERLAAATALLRDGGLTVREIAQQLGVSPATLYICLCASTFC